MSGRMKTLLVVLAVGAGLSFWYVSGLFQFDPLNSSASILGQTNSTGIIKDTDGDGLSDSEETYWQTDYKNPDTDGDGFKDGEEILTGHNPTKAGPDDFLDNKANLTQRASTLLLGGIVTGDLDPTNPNYGAALDALVQKIIEQYTTNVASDTDSIVASSDEVDDLYPYGLTMSRTLKALFTEISANFDSFLETIRGVPLTDLPHLNETNPETFKKFAAAANSEAMAFDGRIDAIKSIPVPPSMASFHKSLLIYLHGMRQYYTTVRAMSSDPVAAMISLQALQTLATETPLELTSAFNNQFAVIVNSK